VKNPCKACPVVNGGRICDRVKNGKSMCPDYALYALPLAERKIQAMQKAIDNECATCEFPERECPHCRWNKFTKRGSAKL
jgi:hypothetical protein